MCGSQHRTDVLRDGLNLISKRNVNLITSLELSTKLHKKTINKYRMVVEIENAFRRERAEIYIQYAGFEFGRT